nr:ankyrin repeat domain-containing protein [Endozoicomonas sp.]
MVINLSGIADKGHVTIINQLIKKDSSVANQENNSGHNALFTALAHQQRNSIETLLDNNANPNAQCCGYNPMHYAAYYNRVDIANLLFAK